MFTAITTKTPAFAVDQVVEVVSAGWGLGPEMISKRCTITAVRPNGDEVIYSAKGLFDTAPEDVKGGLWEQTFKAVVVGRFEPKLGNTNEGFDVFTVEASTDGGDGFKGKDADGEDYHTWTQYWTWEPLTEFEPVAVPTLVVPPVDLGYTELQLMALNTFTKMYEAAVKHREGQSSRLNGDYGICDNIDRFSTDAGGSYNQMAEVKENLIRQTASYSGNYSYPVKGAEGRDASGSFSHFNNKWRGAYGDNRFLQLAEMIELIKHRWSDDLVLRSTPAKRNGLQVGDLVRYTRNNSLWVLRRDDESASPSFHKFNDKDDYTDIDLNSIVKVDADELKQRPVSEFLTVIAEKVATQSDIERQINELQKQLAAVVGDVAMLDYSLADQHKVKRI